MAVSQAPKGTILDTARQEARRGLTLRSFVICIFALLVMGIWVEYEELYNLYGGPLAENSPPNSAVLVILIVLLISVLLYRFRRTLGLTTAEMVVIYTALLVAAPLMTQGMWHRIFGLMAAIPHEQDFKSYESLPTMLWPHGSNLLPNGRFVKGLDGFQVYAESGAAIQQAAAPKFIDMEWRGKVWKCPQLENPAGSTAKTYLEFTVDKSKFPKELVPGESFLFSCLMKADGLQKGAYCYVKMQTDKGVVHENDLGQRGEYKDVTVLINPVNSSPSFSNPNSFTRVGVCPLTVPINMTKSLTFKIGLSGPGKLTLQDIEFFNSEAVEGLYSGRSVIRASKIGTLKDSEKNFLLKKPDNMFSPPGLGYLLAGFIPLAQWAQPALAWTMLIGALFLGFLGFNVIMRRQWVESERFTFPMNILPRQLFGEEKQQSGGVLAPIFRNPVMWIGFGVTLLLALLKGLHYYNTAIPAPFAEATNLSSLVTNPNLKAYLQNVNIDLPLILLAIAMLVETDILFSIWISFLLFQFMFMFGKSFNWNRYPGYPWEWQQAIGSFVAFAFLAVIAARRHLSRVFQQVFRGKKVIDESGEMVSYRTAFLYIFLSLALIIVWGVWTKMGALAALLFFGWMLVCGFAASKIRAECGAPHGYWMPYYGMLFVAAIGGFAIFHTTGMLVATIASGFMCVSCFLFIAPVQVESMELGRNFNVRMKDIGHGLTLGLIGGLFIGGFVLLCWAYGFGADNLATSWPYSQNWYFTNYRTMELTADRMLTSSVPAGKEASYATLNHLKIPKESQAFNWENIDARGIGIGFVVTCILSLFRSLFMWFPLHPIGYVLATTYFARGVWFVAFLAWFIRLIVLRIGGAHTIRKGLVPFCVGMVLACMASIVIFDVVGLYLRHLGVTDIYCKWP